MFSGVANHISLVAPSRGLYWAISCMLSVGVGLILYSSCIFLMFSERSSSAAHVCFVGVLNLIIS